MTKTMSGPTVYGRLTAVTKIDLLMNARGHDKLLGNARVVRYLAQHHRDILTEFQKLAEMQTAAA